MRFERLPEGVREVKFYPALKASIVECSHDDSQRTEKGICRVCKGDVITTGDFTLPVKLLAEIEKRQPEQVALF